ncbi:MAG: subclass B3 metallo-beta-lactamase [Acidobacteriota bacterium]|nr:subclass B3 metallo-beta-lactamase [Acidobacteriota bacterium]MDH3527941.1 subclass B3 metallo-beta-lactamase [Acidobacteriota bacterium]
MSLAHAPVVEGIDDGAGIETQRGSLTKKVSDIAKSQPGEGSNQFKVPTDGQKTAWEEMLNNILDKQPGKAFEIIKSQSFPYKITRFTDDSTEREFLLLEESPFKNGWGFFVFDPDSKSRLIIEVPHAISDENTENEGIEAFLQTGAKAFLLAGTHRRANETLSGCTQATENSRYAESDVAHNTQTMFHKTHEVLSDKYPETVTVQIHGMKSREVCPNVFMSSGSKAVTTNSRKLLECLIRNEVDAAIYDGKTSACPLIARTNVQGRYSNGKGPAACNEYAETSPEPGRFIHIEQEPGIRQDSKSWRPVIDALKCAFPTEKFSRLPITNESWTRMYPPFRIVGNLYYVGGYELASYLITTPNGHILVNTGVYDSASDIQSSVESLGFRFSDIKILLTTQAHWDHVAAFSEIKRRTGARLMVHKDDAPVLESGGVHQFFNSNPLEFSAEFGGAVFEPVKVDRVLRQGDKIRLGGTKLKLHHHPGHTKGASSFSFTTKDQNKKYRVLIVNMGSVNTSRGVRLLGMPLFPNIAKSYAKTFAAQRKMNFDIWVSSHASHFDLHKKHKPGDPYDPKRFVDRAGYKERIEFYYQSYIKTLQIERAESEETGIR